MRASDVDHNIVDRPLSVEDAGTVTALNAVFGDTAALSQTAQVREQRSSRGTLYTASTHMENQAFNVQADLSTLLNSHFKSIRSNAAQVCRMAVSHPLGHA